MSDESIPAQPEQNDRCRIITPNSEATLIDELQADLRVWWDQLGQEQQDVSSPPTPLSEPIDLHTLLSQFTALRHDVNLQTKASRAVGELIAELLKTRDERQTESATVESAVRPLLKVLVDIADNLATALFQVEKVQQHLCELLDNLEAEQAAVAVAMSFDEEPSLQPTVSQQRSAQLRGWFTRLWRGNDPTPAEQLLPNQSSANSTPALSKTITEILETVRPLVASLVDGYSLSLRRVERAFPAAGLEPLDCVGKPFDPETMEAIEVVEANDLASGIVTEEVRRGYRWRGQLFRYALVKVSR